MSHRKPVELSRRALLYAGSLGVLGIVADKVFAQTETQKSQDTLPSDLDSLPADTPGLLAYSRLGGDAAALVRKATYFCAMRAKEVEGNPKKNVEESIVLSNMSPYEKRIFSFEAGVYRKTFYYNYSPLFTQGLPTDEPKPKETAMARRLADLILRDELWTETVSDFRPDVKPFRPDFVFRFADTFPGVMVSVCPDAHIITIEWSALGADKGRSLLFDPVGKEMTAFIKAAFPDDPDAQRLIFTPEIPPPLHPPVTVRPESVSEAAWDSFRSLKAGLMTRAALTQFFETNQKIGIDEYLPAAEYHFTIRKRSGPGPYLTYDASFAPANAFLLWRNGKGFFRRTRDQYTGKSVPARPDDILLSLSPLYLGYPIVWGG